MSLYREIVKTLPYLKEMQAGLDRLLERYEELQEAWEYHVGVVLDFSTRSDGNRPEYEARAEALEIVSQEKREVWEKIRQKQEELQDYLQYLQSRQFSGRDLLH